MLLFVFVFVFELDVFLLEKMLNIDDDDDVAGVDEDEGWLAVIPESRLLPLGILRLSAEDSIPSSNSSFSSVLKSLLNISYVHDSDTGSMHARN